MLDRLINIFLFFALVFVFILYSNGDEHIRILFAFLLALVFSIFTFILNWLTLDGAVAATIFGTIAYGLGDVTGAAVVLTFFVTGSLLSKDQMSSEGFLEKKFRRDGDQVWANGFWFSVWVMIWYLSNYDAFLVAAMASIATATADTWSSEIGQHWVKGKTWLITTGKRVEPGVEGGISLSGTVAALTGAVIISFIFWGLAGGESLMSLFTVIIAGVAGCFIDSYLGARLQGATFNIPALTVIGQQNLYVSNNWVNWLSAGFASSISLIIILIIGT